MTTTPSTNHNFNDPEGDKNFTMKIALAAVLIIYIIWQIAIRPHL